MAEYVDDDLMEEYVDDDPMEEAHEVPLNHNLLGQPQEDQRQRQGNNPRRRPRNYTYDPTWELRRECRRWLSEDPNDIHKARCTVCESSFQANLDVIKRHGTGIRHTRLIGELPPEDEEAADEAERVRREESARIVIVIVLFFVRHRLAFSLIDEFFNLLLNVSQNREALKDAKMKKTKFTSVTTWLASIHKQHLTELLTRNKFSICFDEATDVSKMKKGAVVVRFFNEVTNTFVEALWAIIPIYDDANTASLASGKVIYQRIRASFDNFRTIPKQNVLAFCSDGCPTMVGILNSVASRFRRYFVNIVCIICTAHTIHLVGKAAYALLPLLIQLLPRKLYKLFVSPKRRDMLRKQQKALNLPLHQILRAPPTRWLVLGPAIDRLREQWPALVIVVDSLVAANVRVALNDNDNNNDDGNNARNAARISLRNLQLTMANPITNAYLAFLDNVIPLLESFNGRMQRVATMLPFVYDDISSLMRQIILRITDENFLNDYDFVNFDYRQIENTVGIDPLLIDLGEETEEELMRVEDFDEQDTFRRTCLMFYIEILEEMKDRLETLWRPYRHVNCFIPRNAIDPAYHRQNPNVMQEMMGLFSRAAREENYEINVATLTEEWGNLILFDVRADVEKSQSLEAFWLSISDYRHPDTDAFLFRNLCKFVINCCCIPHGNAQPERVWSEDKLVKTPIRNKLGLKAENAVMLLNDMLRIYGCYDDVCKFTPLPGMIEGILNKAYNPPRRRRNAQGIIDEIGEALLRDGPGGNIPNENVAREVAGEDDDEEDDDDDDVDGWGDEWGSDELNVDELEEEDFEFDELEVEGADAFADDDGLSEEEEDE